jgi:hypothetical protein
VAFVLVQNFRYTNGVSNNAIYNVPVRDWLARARESAVQATARRDIDDDLRVTAGSLRSKLGTDCVMADPCM